MLLQLSLTLPVCVQQEREIAKGKSNEMKRKKKLVQFSQPFNLHIGGADMNYILY